MKITDIKLADTKYALYSWISHNDQDWENGQKRFLDENVTVHTIRTTESGYNVQLEFGDGFIKWVYLNENCYGENIINGVSHRYELKSLNY